VLRQPECLDSPCVLLMGKGLAELSILPNHDKLTRGRVDARFCHSERGEESLRLSWS
jgi:hypothetical protein